MPWKKVDDEKEMQLRKWLVCPNCGHFPMDEWRSYCPECDAFYEWEEEAEQHVKDEKRR